MRFLNRFYLGYFYCKRNMLNWSSIKHCICILCFKKYLFLCVKWNFKKISEIYNCFLSSDEFRYWPELGRRRDPWDSIIKDLEGQCPPPLHTHTHWENGLNSTLSLLLLLKYHVYVTSTFKLLRNNALKGIRKLFKVHV